MEKIKNRIEFLHSQILRMNDKILNTDTFDNEYFEDIKKLSELRNERDLLKEALSLKN